MLERRTDLALEINEIKTEEGKNKGISLYEETINGFHVTTITISPEGEAEAGKPAGRYITADIGRIWEVDRNQFETCAKVISTLLDRLLPPVPSDGGCYLTAGLGNEAITSDAIGPKVVKKLLVTRHIRQSNPEIFRNAGFGSSAAITPGVLGQTGMESSDVVACAVHNCRAHCIIAVDSLASRRLSRLATTIQLADTGISPGSGVYNTRNGLNKETTGVPVIAIGVPTVVDAATLAFDLLEEAKSDVMSNEISEKLLSGRGKAMFITPKESDIISDKLSRLIADAINLTVHKNLSLGEMQEYTS